MPDIVDGSAVDVSFDFDTDPSFGFDVGEDTGTADYNTLTNKPMIEHVILQGDKPIKTWVDEITAQEIDNLMFG